MARPQSSASTRPPSSSSHRPPSSTSTRPASRISRPKTRQSSRLLPLAHSLVSQLTPLSPTEDSDNFNTAVDFVKQNLEQVIKAGAGVDLKEIDRAIAGHVQKAQINSKDDIATALSLSYEKLKQHMKDREKDLDQDIKVSHLPDHLQLLISLSNTPSSATTAYASSYLHTLAFPPPPSKEETLTWADILAEEPFEGDHWEGIFDDGDHSGGSTPSLSPLDSEDEEESSVGSVGHSFADSPSPSPDPKIEKTVTKSKDSQRYAHRRIYEDLERRQYWREGWSLGPHPNLRKAFDIGDPSTLGPAFRRVLQDPMTLGIDGAEQERYIHERDTVREVLMGLQGRENFLLKLAWSSEGTHRSYDIAPNAPRMVHFTLASQASVLSSFAKTCMVLHHLRTFVSSIFHKASQPQSQSQSQIHIRCKASQSRRHTKTVEAFADAVDGEIRRFDMWCAGREEEICRAQCGLGDEMLVVSLLSLEKSIRDTFSETFRILLFDVTHVLIRRSSRITTTTEEFGELQEMFPDEPRIPPARITSFLLDTLIRCIRTSLYMADGITSEALTRVFAVSAEPVWGMVGRWLREGVPVGMGVVGGIGVGVGEEVLDEEFFVECGEIGLLESEFWAEGYVLRGTDEDDDAKDGLVPVFLGHVAELVLASGKAVGLLRVLGVPLRAEGEEEGDGGDWVVDGWRTFGEVISSSPSASYEGGQIMEGVERMPLLSVSTDRLEQVVNDVLMPYCEKTGEMLVRVLVDDCGLGCHLEAIENLFLMRRGDAMSHFADVVFGKMDSHQQWHDFHFLNSTFSDIVMASGKPPWISTSLVRFAYRGGPKDRSVATHRTVKAIDGLLVEYAVPFPLTYIFTPKVLQRYGTVFLWMLQVRRAKSVLERILVRDKLEVGGELKAFYAMRSRLSWFVNTLLNFLTTYVVHTQLLVFHEAFMKAKSLDEMILLHNEHLERIQSRCLLETNTSALHRAILSILDMSLHFTDYFIAIAGDTTHDISRQSLTMKRHRSRRQRQQRRNVIGFSQSLLESHDSSEDDDDENDEEGLQPPEPSFSIATSSVSSTDDGFFNRLEKMSTELDGLVRFIRRGVESLAGGTSEAAPAFGVLAFALEDWDT